MNNQSRSEKIKNILDKRYVLLQQLQEFTLKRHIKALNSSHLLIQEQLYPIEICYTGITLLKKCRQEMKNQKPQPDEVLLATYAEYLQYLIITLVKCYNRTILTFDSSNASSSYQIDLKQGLDTPKMKTAMEQHPFSKLVYREYMKTNRLLNSPQATLGSTKLFSTAVLRDTHLATVNAKNYITNFGYVKKKYGQKVVTDLLKLKSTAIIQKNELIEDLKNLENSSIKSDNADSIKTKIKRYFFRKADNVFRKADNVDKIIRTKIKAIRKVLELLDDLLTGQKAPNYILEIVKKIGNNNIFNDERVNANQNTYSFFTRQTTETKKVVNLFIRNLANITKQQQQLNHIESTPSLTNNI